MTRMTATFLAAVCVCGGVWSGCSKHAKPQVVVYTSVDQELSEPILKDFERQTGIEVLPVYDAESAKTTGLVNRLITRKDSPDCDVFWNNEIVQMQRLAKMQLMQRGALGQTPACPARYRDKALCWVAFAARARVILVNTNLVGPQDMPKSMDDYTDPKWKGKAALANPFFGTSLTHMVVMDQRWGRHKLAAWLDGVRANDVAICPGNAAVKEMVAAGEKAWGVVDTDDANEALASAKPVKVVMLPEPELVLIPNTVGVIRHAPHPAAAKRLAEYLLSAEVERKLAASASKNMPLRTDLKDVVTPWHIDVQSAPWYDVDQAAENVEPVVELLKQKNLGG